MKQMIKGAGAISAVVLAVAMAMCLGDSRPIAGWMQTYLTALALVSVCGFAAWVSDHE